MLLLLLRLLLHHLLLIHGGIKMSILLHITKVVLVRIGTRLGKALAHVGGHAGIVMLIQTKSV